MRLISRMQVSFFDLKVARSHTTQHEVGGFQYSNSNMRYRILRASKCISGINNAGNVTILNKYVIWPKVTMI